MTNSIENIRNFVLINHSELIELRRWFHQYPELSFNEHLTSNFIFEYLSKLGLSINKVAGTGVVCEIGNETNARTIACRFNMDGLPVKEQNDLNYKSKIEGCSHSCGHDFELAWGLMIAKYFSDKSLNSNLKLN